MRKRANLNIVVLAAGLVAGTAAWSAGAVQNYRATPLGTLGGTYAYGSAINFSGQVTGQADISGEFVHVRAFLYSSGTMMDLGTLGGSNSAGNGLNRTAQVTGSAALINQAGHAFLYAGGVMQDLGTLGGAESSGAAVNDNGQVAGSSRTAGNGSQHAFLYSAGSMVDLGSFPSGTFSVGSGINANREVTGSADIFRFGTIIHAFVYSGGTMIDIGTLGGINANSFGVAINDAGEVTGYDDGSFLGRRAFLYTHGTMLNLGTLGGGESQGYGINNKGQVVGTADKPVAIFRVPVAFLYSDGAMYDLNALVVSGLGNATLISAAGINDSGQIIANTCLVPGLGSGCRPYLLDPIPVSPPIIVPTLSNWALSAMVMLLLASGLLTRRHIN